MMLQDVVINMILKLPPFDDTLVFSSLIGLQTSLLYTISRVFRSLFYLTVEYYAGCVVTKYTELCCLKGDYKIYPYT